MIAEDSPVAVVDNLGEADSRPVHSLAEEDNRRRSSEVDSHQTAVVVAAGNHQIADHKSCPVLGTAAVAAAGSPGEDSLEAANTPAETAVADTAPPAVKNSLASVPELEPVWMAAMHPVLYREVACMCHLEQRSVARQSKFQNRLPPPYMVLPSGSGVFALLATWWHHPQFPVETVNVL